MNMLVIGGSAGSLSVVMQILPHLSDKWEMSVVIIFHRKHDDGNLLEILAHRTGFEVKEAEDKELIRPRVIYLAPADYHLLIEKDFSFSLDYSEKVHYCRPSIDVTFESAADVFGEVLVGLLLSGANADGVEGLKEIKKCGGIVAVQNPESAEVAYMPGLALEALDVDYVLDSNDVESGARTLTRLYEGIACKS
jgi:two-component system chemotaxis response regulator CheB